MIEIEKIIKILDEELIQQEKSYFTLQQANKILLEKGIFQESDISSNTLKHLIEEHKIPNVHQTPYKPKQWRILHSKFTVNALKTNLKKGELLQPQRNNDDVEIEPKNKDFLARHRLKILIGIGVIIIFSIVFQRIKNQNIDWQDLIKVETEQESKNKLEDERKREIREKEWHAAQKKEREKLAAKQKQEQKNIKPKKKASAKKQTKPPPRKVAKFRSENYDIERPGVPGYTTIYKPSYHTIDYNKMTVVQKSLLNDQWIEITYRIKSISVEQGALSTTYILHVNSKGLKEVWFSPEIENLGYDYMDGTRIACYELTVVR